MRNVITLLLFLFIGLFPAEASIKLPPILSDNMVLQQQSQVRLWGQAAPFETVTVMPSWEKEGYTVAADAKGEWFVYIQTPEAGTNQSIWIRGNQNEITIRNVLIGEVWLCSGQSNMDFPIGKGASWRTGIANEAEEMKDADYREIRLFHVKQKTSYDKEVKECEGEWVVCNPENLKTFSAVAFFFGRKLHKELKLPVGLIQSSWGGTPAEAWTKSEVIHTDPVYTLLIKEQEERIARYPSDMEQYKKSVQTYEQNGGKGAKPKKPAGVDHPQNLSTLWNGMIAPLVHYAIKGVIWYQGETNDERASDYQHVFTNLIGSWRKEWRQGAFPFYFVQIAPHHTKTPQLREAQLNVWKSVENTGMVVVTDVGDSLDIHPRNKSIPGQRLALFALANTYGKAVPFSGPVYRSMTAEQGSIRLTFDYTYDGLGTMDRLPVTGLMIAGADRKFYPAKAELEKHSLKVSSPEVPNPVAVRYGWGKFFHANLCNSAGLPASPFRTDNWAEDTQTDARHCMFMEYPAVDWREALPTGNGDMGAMLYGNVVRDRILLNHKSFFYKRAHKELPDFSVYLPELRAMMDEGRYEQADSFFMRKIKDSGYGKTRAGILQPGFDVELGYKPRMPFTDYLRTLRFETGEAEVKWKEGTVSYLRSVFVSRADDVAVLRFKADKGNFVSGSVTILPHDFEEVVRKQMGDADKLGLKFGNPVVSADGFICLSGVRLDNGTSFGAVAKVVAPGGRLQVEESSNGPLLVVDSATEILVLTKLFDGGVAEQRYAEMKQALGSLTADYDKLLQRHTAIHRELYTRVELDLNGGTGRTLSNERLLLDTYKGRMDNALTEKMFNYGRFLLICSSDPHGLPAHLQGVWNGMYAPPFQGSFFFNENIQMNYWQALQGNMPEILLSLINLVESGVPHFKENARKYYGCRGILTPIRMTNDFGMKAGAIPQDVFFTGGAGWLAQFFYDYWLFTGDEQFLRNRAVPYMKQVALFYEDFVQKDHQGKLKMYPSDSPENMPSQRKTQLSINATMDFAIMKELLTNLVTACNHLGIEKKEVAKWNKLLAQIPDYQINEDGAIKEWMHPDFKDNYNHRHLSHIYSLFPGFEVTRESNPRIFEACRVAVEKRKVVGIGYQTGWSLAHMANIYARLGEGQEAWDCLNLLTRSALGKNFFTYHNDYRKMGVTLNSIDPPFQIDANFGFTAAVTEMLVYSNPSQIRLLPALPAHWETGSVKGIRCRGGFEVDLRWENHRLVSFTVKSVLGKHTRIFYQDKSFEVNLKKGETQTFSL